ncbi:MAG: AtpZ/AtpI family protein [Bacilli bacterium]
MVGNGRSPMKTMVLTTTVASQVVGTTVLGILGGKWLDNRLETFPIFMIIGLFLGLVAGVYSLYYTLKRYL